MSVHTLNNPIIETSSQNGWLVIINPNAGVRKAERDWPKIECLLDRFGFSYHAITTERPGHAIELTSKYIGKGYRKLLVVGGDGTLNEVVNGIFAQKEVPTLDITIGMITVGTGNDWSRMYHIPNSYKHAIRVIARSETFVQDAGKVSYSNGSNREERYFVNLAGMGFDAQVAKRTNLKKAQGKGGPASYMVNLLQSLVQYKHTGIHIDIDGQVIEAPFFSMTIGICKYNGGGMMQAPHAIADDGLLALTLIRKVSKLKVVRNVKLLYDGSFVKMPEVSTFTGEHIQVSGTGDREILLEADGENLGSGPFDFSIIPRSIRVISGIPTDAKAED